MFGLPSDTWLRLAVWLIVGVAIYFFYGRNHIHLTRRHCKDSRRLERAVDLRMGDPQNENAEANDCEREQGAHTHQFAGETDRQKPRQDRDDRAGDQRRDIGRAKSWMNDRREWRQAPSNKISAAGRARTPKSPNSVRGSRRA